MTTAANNNIEARISLVVRFVACSVDFGFEALGLAAQERFDRGFRSLRMLGWHPNGRCSLFCLPFLLEQPHTALVGLRVPKVGKRRRRRMREMDNKHIGKHVEFKVGSDQLCNVSYLVPAKANETLVISASVKGTMSNA